MRVSPETIYQSLSVQSRGALRRDLTKWLRGAPYDEDNLVASRKPCKDRKGGR
jgi:hypothetical protein